jgi:hypothetical protein
MRKLRIFVVELVLVGILVGWYVWKFPETLDPLIPWILWAIFAHLTWEVLLERETVKLYVGNIAQRRKRSVMTWIVAFVVGGLISLGYVLLAKVSVHKLTAFGANRGHAAEPQETLEEPSFLWVFGAPLGDNASPTWIMIVQHYGPSPAYNCDVQFYDKDRKNIEHQWLVAHPKWPFPPPGIAGGESQKIIHYAEAGPVSPVDKFQWSPVDPNRQHYSASIVCRDGVFVETWEVTRVNGTLRTKITVERGPDWVKKHPRSNPIVFTCTDPEFMPASLAEKLPEPKPLIHPGWKPKHVMEVPVAIIDPNRNVQFLAGVTLPDGSQNTEFGCWSLLTKKLGDKP